MRDCDTTIDTVEKPGRDGSGIDMRQLEISLIKNRLPGTPGSRLKFASGPTASVSCSPSRPGKGGHRRGEGNLPNWSESSVKHGRQTGLLL